jgi:hypothetical protein
LTACAHDVLRLPKSQLIFVPITSVIVTESIGGNQFAMTASDGHKDAAGAISGVPADLAVTWRKSSWSSYAGNCVEIADLPHGRIGIRDTKDAGGPVLVFTRAEFSTFLSETKSGGSDLT